MNEQVESGLSFGSRLRFLTIPKSIFHYALNVIEVIEKDPTELKFLKNRQLNSAGSIVLEQFELLLKYMRQRKPMRFKE
jgi:hypothetical protein